MNGKDWHREARAAVPGHSHAGSNALEEAVALESGGDAFGRAGV